MYLTLRLLFVYLNDDEFQLKLCNLCTHQRDIRLDNEKRYILEPIKNIIINSIKDF